MSLNILLQNVIGIIFITDVPLKVLGGHDGTVTTLLYPFNENTRYEPQHLLSGGSDFAVILWDMFMGTRLHTFTVHGGEITQLLVPPMNCNVSYFCFRVYNIQQKF